MKLKILSRLTLLFAAATAIYPRWIETVLGVDPDHGSGLLETLIVLVAVLTVISLVLREVRRAMA